MLTILGLRPRFTLLTVILLASFMLTLFASRSADSQTPDPNQEHHPQQKKFTRQTDLSVGIYGQLTDTRMPTTISPYTGGVTTTQTIQAASTSPGVFTTFHQSFKPWLGYNVNFGYTRFSENYSYGIDSVPTPPATSPVHSTYSQGSLRTNMTDLTIAWVFNGPHNGRLTTFGQFGGGGLFFLPVDRVLPLSYRPATYQTRPTMIFGAGINYKLTGHLGLRAEYRGLFYKSPDFGLPPGNSYNFPMTRLFTVTNAPAVSLVYRFGGTKLR